VSRVSSDKPDRIQPITTNRKALHDYHVDEEVEAGLVLKGTEVKALREAKVQLNEAYARIERGEAFLFQMHVAEYDHGNIYNHEPTRTRKLLLNRHEIDRLQKKVTEKGYTLIPLRMYFKNGRVKVVIGLCKGKKDHDKRHTIRDRDLKREMDRDMERDR
jgi:SsrA-binding protein